MTARNSSTCIVFGNGPSLRGFDFHRLKNLPTLGMNAAYRHWDRIGWYPTYYACLDDQLIESHHIEIERLYADGLIQKFFLHRKFFDYHPHRLGNVDFTMFDQTSKHWYGRIAKPHGLPPLFDQPAFRISDTSKITTGSHAVRYVANLGFKRILLLGIDLRYVEILPEAVPTEGVGLKIAKTPKHNPNYFFEGYQKAGDLYNIPNPSVHEGRLHQRSFELIEKDFLSNNLECEIFTGNKKSVLWDENIFPFMSVESVLDHSPLSAVFIPCNEREIPDILKNFKIWSVPPFAPSSVAGKWLKPALVLVFNNRSSIKKREVIRSAFYENRLDRFFERIVFEYLDLQGQSDSYQRDYSSPAGPEGYKAGPNNQFFSALRLMQKYGRYSFLMEVDCVPVRRGWLDALQDLISQSEDFWVMGSAYRGDDMLSIENTRHINGNAIYAAGDPSFQEFVRDFWEFHTWRIIRDVDKRIAYDCALAHVFTDEGLRDKDRLKIWNSTAHLFRFTSYIQNISSKRDLQVSEGSLIQKIRQDSPETFLLHNRVIQGLVADDIERSVETYQAPSAWLTGPRGYPRLLVLDMTPIGNFSATGELKASLLAEWPAADLLQIAKQGETGLATVVCNGGRYVTKHVDMAAARAAISSFEPDIILYRPVPDAHALHSLAMEEIKQRGLPLVTWIMDDWPARMAVEDPEGWSSMELDLKVLWRNSSVRLSISEAMSETFCRRYGVPFRPLANGVDPADWPSNTKASDKDGIFRVRFAGGLAPDMNRESILRIAEAVERIALGGKRISFQINTQNWWLDETKDLFSNFKHTQVLAAKLDVQDYRSWLSQSDICVIAYNFDEASMRYVRYSMANKMPECLASGAVVLAHGPRDVATIDYLAGVEGAVVVSENSGEAVENALRALIDSPVRCAELAAKARATAFDRHNIIRLRADLRRILTDAAQRGSGVAHSLPELRGNAPLTHFSALLLMDPKAALAELGSDSALKTIVAAAVANDATDPQLSEHLKRCLAFAKIDLNKLE